MIRGAAPRTAALPRFRPFTGRWPDGTTESLCRLRYGGVLHTWGFAVYRANHNDSQPNFLSNGTAAGSPDEALDCACGLYLNDPTAWLLDTPTS